MSRSRPRARITTMLAASVTGLGLLSCIGFGREASSTNLTPTCEGLSETAAAIRSPEDHGFFRVGTTRSGFAHYAGVSQAEVVRFYPKQVPSGGRQTSYTINETRLWVKDGRYFCLGLQASGSAETFPSRQVEALLPSLEGNLSAREVEVLKEVAFNNDEKDYFSTATYSTNISSVDGIDDALSMDISNRTGLAIVLLSYPASWIESFLL